MTLARIKSNNPRPIIRLQPRAGVSPSVRCSVDLSIYSSFYCRERFPPCCCYLQARQAKSSAIKARPDHLSTAVNPIENSPFRLRSCLSFSKEKQGSYQGTEGANS